MSDKKNKESFPGYPHYPAGEDITNSGNSTGRENVNDEDIPASHKINAQELSPNAVNEQPSDENDDIVMGTDADVTAEDLQMLELADQNTDTEDGRNLAAASLDETDDDGDPLNEEGANGFVSGDELDVPGAELDDTEENEGEEDEENNYYSLGGDNHESQEENKGE